jgi:hypothetical protein
VNIKDDDNGDCAGFKLKYERKLSCESGLSCVK